MERLQEVQIKLARVREFLGEQGLSGVLLKKQPNFSWLTAGGLNMVGIATETGATALLVTPEKHYLITNRIEEPRMLNEEGLADLGFISLGYEWFEDKEMNLVREVVGDGPVGIDMPHGNLKNVDTELKKLRYTLTEGEIDRYLWMGEKVSAAIEKILAEVEPGDSEAEITGRLSAELWKDRIDPTGFMAAADQRAFLYRHPIPTQNRVKQYLMLCVNARYTGLIITITRFVHFGPLPDELRRQYEHNVEIECKMIARTQVGCPMKDAFLAGLDLYRMKGYQDEWKLHHQGGSMGYYARDIKVTELTEETVRLNQAFCWNPSITGTKSEDGFIVTAAGPQMITKPVTFPVLEMEVDSLNFTRPAILER